MTDPASNPDNTQETFISHLVELRSRLMRSIIAVVIVLLCLFPWAKEIYAFLAAPLLKALPHGSTMIATDVTGTFLVPLKVTLMAAFLIALPYVLYQMWAFVAPGLYRHEQRLAAPVIVSSVFFFALGMSFAYFAVFPIAFGFFADYAPAGVQMMTDIDKYLSFVLTMFIAFGITFEVPVVVIVLVRLGVVSLERCARYAATSSSAHSWSARSSRRRISCRRSCWRCRCGCCSNWDCWWRASSPYPSAMRDAGEEQKPT